MEAATTVERQERVRQAAMIIAWLERNPFEQSLILWMAEHDGAVTAPVDYEALTPDGIQRLERTRAGIQRFMAGFQFVPCGRCFAPVVVAPDGQELGWPGLREHRVCRFDSPGEESPKRTLPQPTNDGLPPVKATKRALPPGRGLRV